MNTFLHLLRYIFEFYLKIINISYKSCRENQNTRFTFSNFSRNSYPLWDNVENSGGAREATDDKPRWRMATYPETHTNRHIDAHTKNR
jgi:hypothetical protein